MPLIRPLVKIGGSRYIPIPPKWLEYWERKTGKPIEELLMEVNNKITLMVEPPPKKKESVGA